MGMGGVPAAPNAQLLLQQLQAGALNRGQVGLPQAQAQANAGGALPGFMGAAAPAPATPPQMDTGLARFFNAAALQQQQMMRPMGQQVPARPQGAGASLQELERLMALQAAQQQRR